ncbi:MAG: VWA domain-containing protein [Rhodospirillales bacterium]|nr:VWA domain-containing protein [Rhodospirillales bacterium]
MRPTRREASIFSVSAIDLFASALGAFVIVSFVLFPYFPNTGEVPPAPVPPPTPPPPEPAPPTGISAAEAAALEERIGGLERQLAEARSRQSELDEELGKARSRESDLAQALDEATSPITKLPPLDLVIALDTTGSMTNEVASLREEIAGLAELLVELTDDAAVGIIDFKDRCDPRTAIRIAPLRPVNRTTVRELTAFARSMSPGGSWCNDTDPEDYATALRTAAQSAWRASSERRSIVMISDNPAYWDARAQAVSDAAAFAQRPGARHTVSSVYVETQTPLRDTPDFMRRVAQAGRGRFVEADRNASLSVTILLAVFRS